MGEWFAGICADLATDRYDATALAPTGYWVGGDPGGRWVPIRADGSLAPLGDLLAPPIPYPDQVGDLLREHARRLALRERNMAMLLFGVHT